ncbi:hypothetical protein SISNIDRAFT_471392 [Sistotremastrum niveocremeum HHB9708]|uniref:Uncharacterized protein n=1 Tax=Sistotremastrum niveocremeum HHB9708 TaxID=1314777 RepID=A0A164MPC6_9AGAM|nr:hypothetical protein SISNIDRAFT_471392 [Sistotremastrum niveocremeum HHB9708]
MCIEHGLWDAIGANRYSLLLLLITVLSLHESQETTYNPSHETVLEVLKPAHVVRLSVRTEDWVSESVHPLQTVTLRMQHRQRTRSTTMDRPSYPYEMLYLDYNGTSLALGSPRDAKVHKGSVQVQTWFKPVLNQ